MACKGSVGKHWSPSGVAHAMSLCLLGCVLLNTCMVSVVSSMEATSCESVTKLYPQDMDLKLFQDSSSNAIYYRHLTIDTESRFLFVGAMNRLFGLYLNNIENESKRLKQSFWAPKSNQDKCITNGKNKKPDCQNHVRVLIRNSNSSNTFYMCSTGAYQPIAYQLRLENNKFAVLKDDMDGVGVCPYDPRDNATALLVEHGISNMPSLYSGTYIDFVKSDPVITRFSLDNQGSPMRTLRSNNWLNEPQFVGSFDVGDYVYMFYREVALEYTNCGKKIYSRVARICKNDNGGRLGLRNTWLSFVKARLNCSIPGEYPYYFDEIQDVHQIGETFYGLFTTNNNGVRASAICAFGIHSINKAFEGSIKRQHKEKKVWLPVPESDMPKIRPGDCKATSQLSGESGSRHADEFSNFLLSSGMLMDKAVKHVYNKPIFYQSHALMQKLYIDKNVSGKGDLVFFTATNTGEIYKIAAWQGLTPRDSPKTYLVTKFIPFSDNRPIWSLLMYKLKPKSWLYFGTDMAVGQVDVQTCNQYKKIDLCIYDPYCGWDRNMGECRSNEHGNLIGYTDIDLLSYSLEEAIRKTVGQLYSFEEIPRISGSSVTFSIEYLLSISGNIHWTKNGSQVSGKRHILAQDKSLIVTDIRKSDEGLYKATDDHGRTVAEYRLKVETSKEQIEQRWMRKFDQWCDEFERYQEDIKQWENKCSTCCQESTVANMLPALDGK